MGHHNLASLNERIFHKIVELESLIEEMEKINLGDKYVRPDDGFICLKALKERWVKLGIYS